LYWRLEKLKYKELTFGKGSELCLEEIITKCIDIVDEYRTSYKCSKYDGGMREAYSEKHPNQDKLRLDYYDVNTVMVRQTSINNIERPKYI
jgi:hypothetical protein